MCFAKESDTHCTVCDKVEIKSLHNLEMILTGIDGLDWTTIWGCHTNKNPKWSALPCMNALGYVQMDYLAGHPFHECWDENLMPDLVVDAIREVSIFRFLGWLSSFDFISTTSAVVWFTSQISHRKRTLTSLLSQFLLWQGMSPQLHVHNRRSHHDKRAPDHEWWLSWGLAWFGPEPLGCKWQQQCHWVWRHQLSKTIALVRAGITEMLWPLLKLPNIMEFAWLWSGPACWLCVSRNRLGPRFNGVLEPLLREDC